MAHERLKREQEATAQLTNKREKLLRENAALESELTTVLACCHSDRGCDHSVERATPHLFGRKILYVGGRSNLVRHYKALVERHGGEFIHHDGGLESSLETLKNGMVSADAVICPIDCVSHSACQSVKQTCKHLDKPFIPLRSAGLSSFARSIQTI